MSSQQSALFRNPYSGYENTLPQQFADANNMISAYQRAYDQHNNGVTHPGKAALFAFLGGGGLVGALTAKDKALAVDQQRQANLANQYQQWANQQLTNQKALDDITQTRYQTQYNQAVMDKGKILGAVDMNVPNLYDQSLAPINPDGTIGERPKTDIPNYSREFLEGHLKSAFAPSDINTMRNLNLATTIDNYRLPTNLGMGGGGPQTPNTIQGGVSEKQYTPTPVDLPFYIANPDQIMQSMTTTGTNALNQGQNRYQFDQQAPDRAAERKLKEFQAQVEAVNAKTQPQYRQAQINSLNYRPPGGGGSMGEFETIWQNATPEQRMQMIQNKTSGYSPNQDNQALLSLQKQIYEQNDKGQFKYGVGDPALPALVRSYNEIAGRVGKPRLRVKGSGGTSKPSPMLPSKGGFTTSGGVKVRGL